MKKLFYVGALSAFLLAACEDSETPEKDFVKKSNEEVEEVNEQESLSDAQIATFEAFKSNDFKSFADALYALPAPERSEIYLSDISFGHRTTICHLDWHYYGFRFHRG